MTLPGLSAPEASPPPAGFTEITGTPDGHGHAVDAATRAQAKGRVDARPDDFRVFRRSDRIGPEYLTVHRAIEATSVALVDEGGSTRAEVQGDLSDATVAGWRVRQDAAMPPTSARAADEDSTTRSGQTGGGGTCYDLVYSTNWVEFQSCWDVTYDGYDGSYYYYVIEQDISAKSKAYAGYASWLIDMDIEADRNYGTSWAGTNSKSPAQSVSKSCGSYTLSVSFGSFDASKGTQVCETWTPTYNSFADYYHLDWNGTVGYNIWRHMDYLLLQRRYRDPSWSYTFHASVNWTT